MLHHMSFVERWFVFLISSSFLHSCTTCGLFKGEILTTFRMAAWQDLSLKTMSDCSKTPFEQANGTTAPAKRKVELLFD